MAIDPEKTVLTIVESDITLDDDELEAWKRAFAKGVKVVDVVSLEGDPFEVTFVTESLEPSEAGNAIASALKAQGMTEGTFELTLGDFDPTDEDFEAPPYSEQELDLALILSGEQDFDEIDGP